MTMLDVLLKEVSELASRAEERGLSLLLGGGMGLYLRDQYLGGRRSPRYPVRPRSRSTKDVDLFLSAKAIVDASHMTRLRNVLVDMGYAPREGAAFFQFERQVRMGSEERTLRVDLLAAPPGSSARAHVKVDPPRIRPREMSEPLHGRLTEEARGIHLDTIVITVPRGDSEGSVTIHLPSSFNYLILKLHAFEDRKDQDDELSDRGRHHAFDIFRIVTDMREEDWDAAERHVNRHGEARYVRRTARLQRTYFSDEYDEGVIRLKDNDAYRRHREAFDAYLPDVLGDLRELFANVEPSDGG